VPIIPGLLERSLGSEAIAAFAAREGYPILLKAAAGGGGKGMRVVREPSELEAALRGARAEAKASFGDDGVYAEKLLEGVRHIEIQVMADAHGQAVHLGERECSLQRRHQKLIEEAPSVAVTDELRRRMGALALDVVRASGYRNAGTVEFLLDREERPYFMEVNARIQVEHPVTELVTGLDLVREQIRIAAGEPLSFRQEDVRPRGHAIECRILAEDPAAGFRPCPGRIEAIRLPEGPGIRVDTALQAGDEISLHYDALIAKCLAWRSTACTGPCWNSGSPACGPPSRSTSRCSKGTTSARGASTSPGSIATSRRCAAGWRRPDRTMKRPRSRRRSPPSRRRAAPGPKRCRC
jgi:acetyl-CoA carboxylase biotin carboxylase subunit